MFPGVNILKVFTFITDDEAQCARGFAIGNPFQSSLIIRARPEQTRLEDLADASFLGKLLVLPAKVRQDWKVIARYKDSSLFGRIISNEEKKSFITMSPELF
jgi:hypothetical protein